MDYDSEIGRGAQFIPHAPGPRGSPHEPQGPGSDGADGSPWARTAKTESCFSSLVPAQLGHDGGVEPRTMVSKRWSQVAQRYSKIGTGPSSLWCGSPGWIPEILL